MTLRARWAGRRRTRQLDAQFRRAGQRPMAEREARDPITLGRFAMAYDRAWVLWPVSLIVATVGLVLLAWWLGW